MNYNDEIELDLKHWFGKLLMNMKKVWLLCLVGLLVGFGMSFKSLPTHEKNIEKAIKELDEKEIATVDSLYSQYEIKVENFERVSNEMKNSYVFTLDYRNVPEMKTRYVVNATDLTALSFLKGIQIKNQEFLSVNELVGGTLSETDFNSLISVWSSSINNGYELGYNVLESNNYKDIYNVTVDGFDEAMSESIVKIIMKSVQTQIDAFNKIDEKSQIHLTELDQTFDEVEKTSILGLQDSYNKSYEDANIAVIKAQEAPSTFNADQKSYYNLLIKNGLEIEEVDELRHLKGLIKGAIGGFVLGVVYSLLQYAMGGYVRTIGSNDGSNIVWLDAFYYDDKKKRSLLGKRGKALVVKDDELTNEDKLQMLTLQLEKTMKQANMNEVYIAKYNDSKHESSMIETLKHNLESKGIVVKVGNPSKNTMDYDAFLNAKAVLNVVLASSTKFEELTRLMQNASEFKMKQLGIIVVEELN